LGFVSNNDPAKSILYFTTVLRAIVALQSTTANDIYKEFAISLFSAVRSRAEENWIDDSSREGNCALSPKWYTSFQGASHRFSCSYCRYFPCATQATGGARDLFWSFSDFELTSDPDQNQSSDLFLFQTPRSANRTQNTQSHHTCIISPLPVLLENKEALFDRIHIILFLYL
jgi:hypothetical protein